MAATTVEIDIRRLTTGTPGPLPVAAATRIPAGALVALNASGYAVNAADSANFKVVGYALETIDNSGGSAGDLTVPVADGPSAGWVNDGTNPCTIAHVGRPVYVKDNQTIQSATGTNSIKAGTLIGIADNGSLMLNIIPNP